jgi:hypothetical protein
MTETLIGLGTALALGFAGAVPAHAEAGAAPAYVVVELKVTDAAAFQE